MNQSDLVKKFQEATKIPGVRAKEYFDSLCDIMSKELVAGGDVPLRRIGRLVIKERAARQGRNPRTGATLSIPACKVLTIHTSKDFKESLNR